MRAKSLQSCPTLCDPMDCSSPGSSVLGIPQARILENNPLLQGIFPTQGANPRPLHWKPESQPLDHQGSPQGVDFIFICFNMLATIALANTSMIDKYNFFFVMGTIKI